MRAVLSLAKRNLRGSCFSSPAQSLSSCSKGTRSTSTSSYKLFLHVGPSGDCWSGASIFAAKHLQPDYVKSMPLPEGFDVDSLLEKLEANPSLAQKIYDEAMLPHSLFVEFSSEKAQK